ncbi:hypothetical protein [Neoaquamicrobium sediminum]|uniref:Uncharacterized protein n=1 Tax=Neoaquamicrobium sediminum TaxID=1849104 RepID=A0ABV3WU15_9HYPH
MKDNALQFTMREMQRVAASPLPWAALAGAALVLGMVGPFGTYESLRLPARLAYWAAIVVSTYFLGSPSYPCWRSSSSPGVPVLPASR